MNKVSLSGGDQFIETWHTLVKLSANPAYEQVTVWEHFNARLYQFIRGRVEDEGAAEDYGVGHAARDAHTQRVVSGGAQESVLDSGEKFL